MIDAGLLVYYGTLKDLAHFAGVYEQDDWMLVDERTQRFKPLFNDEYGNSAIAGFSRPRSHADLTPEPQPAPDGPLLKVSGPRCGRQSPTRCWPTTEWTAGVGPLRPGGTSLLAKTAPKWTTTEQK